LFSNWLVNKAKIEPKTVQDILRHSKFRRPIDLHTQEDSDETRAAQGEFLSAVEMNARINYRWIVRWSFPRHVEKLF